MSSTDNAKWIKATNMPDRDRLAMQSPGTSEIEDQEGQSSLEQYSYQLHPEDGQTKQELVEKKLEESYKKEKPKCSKQHWLRTTKKIKVL